MIYRADALSRRAILRASLAVAGTNLVGARARACAQANVTPDAFETLRLRWVSMLTGGTDIDHARLPFSKIIADVAAHALVQWHTMAVPANAAEALWSDPLAGDREYNSRISADRLRVMALAWATPGSSLYQDPKLEEALLAALGWFEKRRYNIWIERTGNWWEWEMGIPIALVDILFLLHDRLKAHDAQLLARLSAAIDRFTPAAHVGTAANRVWRSHIVALNAVLMHRADKIAAASAAIPTTFGDIVEGDGFHADGSFLQHDDLAYTGGYGRDLLVRASLIVYLLQASHWSLEPDRVASLIARVHSAYAPFIYRGAVMDMVRGRNMSRANLSDIASGQIMIHALLYLSEASGDRSLAATAKGWIVGQRRVYDVFAYDPKLPAYWLTPHMARLSCAVIEDRHLAAAPDPVGSFAFAEMDRFVHRRPGFAFGVSMNSSRIANYESVNDENLRGWYQGHGATWLYTPDHPNFASDFWATVDPLRLPGITLDRRKRVDAARAARNESAFAGCLTNGAHGMAAMHNETDGASFAARKSWVAVGDMIIALGSGITSQSEARVETVIENRILHEKAVIRMDGDLAGEALSGARWIHVQGVGGIVLTGESCLLRREVRTGLWRDINRQGASPADPRTQSYATIWIDHGTRPRDARYAYALMPGASLARTRAISMEPSFHVIRNDAAVHALQISDGRDLIHAYTLWDRLDDPEAVISGTAPLIAMMHVNGNAMELAIADPAQNRSGIVEAVIQIPSGRILRCDTALALETDGKSVRLQLDRTDLRGRTIRASFEKKA